MFNHVHIFYILKVVIFGNLQEKEQYQYHNVFSGS